MSIRIDGTNTTANPGITGGDADTGLQFGTDEVSIVTGGTERVKVDNGALKVTGQSSGITDGGITFDWESVSQSGRIFAESSAASQFKFYTTNSAGVRSEQMRITDDGYVQKYAHPAFEVALNDGDATSGNLIPTHVQLNRGSHYSTSTGLFTAPVTGVYCFYYGSIKSGDGPSVVRIYLEVNNVTQYDSKHLRLAEDNLNYAENASLIWTVYLAADDQVRVDCGAGAVYGNTKEYFHFGGYFIG